MAHGKIFLPKSVIDALKNDETNCMPLEVNGQFSMVAAIDKRGEEELRGPMAVGLNFQLGMLRTGAVLAVLVEIFLPDGSGGYKLDGYLNLGNERDRRLVEKFLSQEMYAVHFVDNRYGGYRFSKVVRVNPVSRADLKNFVEMASDHLKKIGGMNRFGGRNRESGSEFSAEEFQAEKAEFIREVRG